MTRKWRKEEKRWAVGGLAIPILIGLLAFFQTDLRKLVGLDKPTQIVVPAPTQPKPPSQTDSPSSASLQPKQQSNNNVKGKKNVVGNNVSGKGNVVGNGNQVSQGNSSVTNVPGGIVNNGGMITNPTVNNFPPSHPLAPYDGVPDSKVAEDAIGMANRFFNSVKSCNDGWQQAVQQDIDTKQPNQPSSKLYISKTKRDIQKYSKHLRDLQTSLIYRLGPAEREADADETLDRLLEKRNPADPMWYFNFNCWQLQDIGEYFHRLGDKLKVRASAHP